MHRCRYGILVLSVLVLASCKLQNQQRTKDPRLSSFRESLAQQMKGDQIPGLQLTFFSKDRILFSESFGVADVEAQLPMTNEHLMRVASVSKIFTAVTLKKILDARQISVQTRLFDFGLPFVIWLKSLNLRDREYWEQVTLADLLGHTAMLPMEYPEPVDGIWPSDKAVERQLAKISFIARPGDLKSGVQYCNFGPIILARLIADFTSVTGLPDIDFHSAVREEILRSLDMKSTEYTVNEANEANEQVLAKRYSSVKAHAPGPELFRYEVPPVKDPAGYSGAAGLISRTEDLARFFQSLMRTLYGGSNSMPVLSRASLIEMLEPRAVVDRKKLFGLGFSWLAVGTHSRLLIGHTGGGAGEAAMVAFAPDTGLGLAIQMNAKTSASVLTSYFEKIFSDFERQFRQDAEVDIPEDLIGLELHARDLLEGWQGSPFAVLKRQTEGVPDVIKPVLGIYMSKFSDDVELFWSYGGQLAISHNGEYPLAAVKLEKAQFQIVGRSHEETEFVEILCDSQNRVMRLRLGQSKYFDSALWGPDVGPLQPCQLFEKSAACENLL